MNIINIHIYYCTNPGPHFGPNNVNSITHIYDTN